MDKLETLFWSKVEKTPTCWIWKAGRFQGRDYGQFHIPRWGPILAHRFAYEHTKGKIPDGLVLHHICYNRRCVNPNHLKPVTQRENVMSSPSELGVINIKKTHCPKGHPYTPDNVAVGKLTRQHRRECMACAKERSFRQWRLKRAIHWFFKKWAVV